MKKAILGKKVGMTQVFTSKGEAIPVTVIEAGPCTVVQIKTEEKDGYKAVVAGFDQKREKLFNKPETGVFKKAGVTPKRYLRELDTDDYETLTVGSEIKCSVFKEGDIVDVTGISKGHGFSGSIKRHGQRRTQTSHGGGPVHRQVGSLGSSSDASKVFKNRPMPGHFGVEQVTIQNLTVVRVDEARNALLIKGAIPGPKNGLVEVRSAVKVN